MSKFITEEPVYEIKLFSISILTPPEDIEMTPEDWINCGCGYVIKDEKQTEREK